MVGVSALQLGLTQCGQRLSGVGVPQQSYPLQNGQSPVRAAASAATYFGAHNGPSTGSDGWFMPTYKGRDICDWGSDISALKRSGDLSSALVIARGCMDAMITAARLNPVNVAEHLEHQVPDDERNNPSRIMRISHAPILTEISGARNGPSLVNGRGRGRVTCAACQQGSASSE